MHENIIQIDIVKQIMQFSFISIETHTFRFTFLEHKKSDF
jgi:hypothetical protein